MILLPRITVDFERLMAGLLAYPGLTVSPTVDVDSFDHLPLLTFSGGNGAMISNGNPPAGWSWTLFLNLFTDGLADGAAAADTIYQNVHGMESRYIGGVGAVASVEDEAMFDRIGGASLPDKRIVQHRASFTVLVVPV